MYEGTKFVYDERRKELRGSKIWLMKGEEEIKKTLADLNKQKEGYEKAISQIKEIVESPELTEELKELKSKIETLQRIQIKEEKSDALKEQLKQNEEDIAEVKKDIDKIKQAIGSRINLK